MNNSVESTPNLLGTGFVADDAPTGCNGVLCTRCVIIELAGLVAAGLGASACNGLLRIKSASVFVSGFGAVAGPVVRIGCWLIAGMTCPSDAPDDPLDERDTVRELWSSSKVSAGFIEAGRCCRGSVAEVVTARGDKRVQFCS